MRNLFIGVSVAAIAAAGVGLAVAQSGPAGPGALDQVPVVTCGDLAGLDSADQTALLYYAAGYQQANIDALAGPVVTSSQPDETDASISSVSMAPLGDASASTELGAVSVTDPALDATVSSASASASEAMAPSSEPPAQGLGSVQLDIAAIVNACSGSPDAKLVDVLAANGGPVNVGAPPVAQGNVTGTTDLGITAGPAQPATNLAQPGAAGTNAEPSSAISNDINAVSQQLNNSIVSNEVNAAPPSDATDPLATPAPATQIPAPVPVAPAPTSP